MAGSHQDGNQSLSFQNFLPEEGSSISQGDGTFTKVVISGQIETRELVSLWKNLPAHSQYEQGRVIAPYLPHQVMNHHQHMKRNEEKITQLTRQLDQLKQETEGLVQQANRAAVWKEKWMEAEKHITGLEKIITYWISYDRELIDEYEDKLRTVKEEAAMERNNFCARSEEIWNEMNQARVEALDEKAVTTFRVTQIKKKARKWRKKYQELRHGRE